MDPSSVWYIEGEQTGEVLDAFFRTVAEWLHEQKFCQQKPGVLRMPIPIGHLLLCPRGVDDDHWHMYYEAENRGKDIIGNAIVIAKVEKVPARRYGLTDNRETRYVCRFFQCELADPNLWERTVNALRAFRYSYWPK